MTVMMSIMETCSALGGMEERGTLASREIKEGFTEKVISELDFKDEVLLGNCEG